LLNMLTIPITLRKIYFFDQFLRKMVKIEYYHV